MQLPVPQRTFSRRLLSPVRHRLDYPRAASYSGVPASRLAAISAPAEAGISGFGECFLVSLLYPGIQETLYLCPRARLATGVVYDDRHLATVAGGLTMLPVGRVSSAGLSGLR